MTDEDADDFAQGRRSGRSWAEESLDGEALALIEAIDLKSAEAADRALDLYMRCIDPEGNLALDDIVDGFEASGRTLTGSYLFGFIAGAREAIEAAKRRPAN
jgi:hypothetical protein